MITSAQIGSLRDDGMFANIYFTQAVDHDIITYPTIVADFHFPRVSEDSRRADDRLDAYPSAEDAQDGSPERIGELWGPTKHSGLNEPPQLHHQCRAASKTFGKFEFREVLVSHFDELAVGQRKMLVADFSQQSVELGSAISHNIPRILLNEGSLLFAKR